MTEQLPVARIVRHVVAERLPGPLTIEKVMVVPAGALLETPFWTTLTCPVTVCGVPTGFVPSSPIWMFAVQSEKSPRAKSFRVASTDWEERVSARKLPPQPYRGRAN